MRFRIGKCVVPSLLLMLCVPTSSWAQSAIAGLVTDHSGSVLPGVTVEASSPALIEKVRSVVSDGSGRYSIVDLRPGEYTISFALEGFTTVRRSGVSVSSNVNVPINAVMEIGAIEESITVSGVTPVVDVQTNARREVLSRDTLDGLPTARNMQQIGALIPGLKTSGSDVGGANSMNQTYVSGHGVVRKETTYQIDGMDIRTLSSDGIVQMYTNEAANQEMTFQTSAIGADTGAGGVRLNIIPREGGNRLSGSIYAGGSPSSFIGENITQDLKDRGFTVGDSTGKIYETSASVGGPIRRDKLWFFGAVRRQAVDQIFADTYSTNALNRTNWWVPPTGAGPGVNDQWINNLTGRVTAQVTPRNKLTVFADRVFKWQGHDLVAGDHAETSARITDPAHAVYYVGQAKWTSTISNRFMLETGYSSSIETRTSLYEPDVVQGDRGSAAWYANAAHQDLITARRWKASADGERGVYPGRYVLSSSASYVTGSHAAKAGVQWGFGSERNTRSMLADLVQLYRNGVPDSVRVFNTPTVYQEAMNADLGIFAQDTWTRSRLTINLGVRLDHFNSSIEATEMGAGRFAPARTLARVENLPNWTNLSPRLGAAYDLFGNAKTAVKGSFGRYMETWATGYANRYNPVSLTSETRTWSDCDVRPGTSTCSGTVLSTNGDDIAQDNEIGPTQNSQFGLPVLNRRPADGLKRGYNIETTIGLQHQLAPGLGLNVMWYRRAQYNQARTENVLLTNADYTPVNVVSPLDGSVITVYNLNAAKLGQVERVDVNSTDLSRRRNVYNGFEVSFSGKLPFGGSAFGGWTSERTIDVACDFQSDPNTLRFCDQSALGIPFLHEFKIAGSQPLPFGFVASAALASYAGGPTGAAAPISGGALYTGLSTNWSLSRTTRYAADCVGPCTPGALVVPGLTQTSLIVPLVEPGTRFLERRNQLDLGVRRAFRFGTRELSGSFQVFNVTNSNSILGENQTFGSSLGRPTATLQPRVVRLSAQFKF